jgi:hypothetical protein
MGRIILAASGGARETLLKFLLISEVERELNGF